MFHRAPFPGLGVDVENILAAPTGGIGVVLIAAQAPFGLLVNGSRGMRRRKRNFLPSRPGQLHALHQDVQRFRVTVGAHLGRTEVACVAIVLELVDGLPHFAQGVAQVALALRAHLVARQRHCHGWSG